MDAHLPNLLAVKSSQFCVTAERLPLDVEVQVRDSLEPIVFFI